MRVISRMTDSVNLEARSEESFFMADSLVERSMLSSYGMGGVFVNTRYLNIFCN